jgi:hypothetical protein
MRLLTFTPSVEFQDVSSLCNACCTHYTVANESAAKMKPFLGTAHVGF